MAVSRSLDHTWGHNITFSIAQRLILTTFMTIRDSFRVTRQARRVLKAPMRHSSSQCTAPLSPSCAPRLQLALPPSLPPSVCRFIRRLCLRGSHCPTCLLPPRRLPSWVLSLVLWHRKKYSCSSARHRPSSARQQKDAPPGRLQSRRSATGTVRSTSRRQRARVVQGTGCRVCAACISGWNGARRRISAPASSSRWSAPPAA